MYKEERDVSEEMRELDECVMEDFTLLIVFRYYLLSYRGKIWIDYQAQGNPYNTPPPL